MRGRRRRRLPVQERRGVHPRRGVRRVRLRRQVHAGPRFHLPGAARRRSTSCWPTRRRSRASRSAMKCASTAVDVQRRRAAPRVHAQRRRRTRVRRRGRFVLDASGFGRTLPRLLELETPSTFPGAQRRVHARRGPCVRDGAFDRNKIQVVVHPQHRDVWYWLIPFPHGRCSLGCVARQEFFDAYPSDLDAAAAQARRARSRSWRACWRTRMGHAGARACPATPPTCNSMHGPGLRAARQRRGVSRSGVLLGRDDRDALGEHGGGTCSTGSCAAKRWTGSRSSSAAAQGRRHVPRLRARVVRRPLSGHHVREDAAAGDPPHDLLDPRRLRLGRERIRSSPSRSGGWIWSRKLCAA